MKPIEEFERAFISKDMTRLINQLAYLGLEVLKLYERGGFMKADSSYMIWDSPETSVCKMVKQLTGE